MTSRAGKIELGAHEYREGPYTICRMGDNWWDIFINKSSVGHAYKTLREARAYCKWAARNNLNKE